MQDKLKECLDKIIERCGKDVSISTHMIQAEDETWKSVCEADHFFKDVQDEYDAHEEENIIKLNNQTYDVKGYLSLHDLNDYLDLDLDSEDFDSVGGLVIDALGRLPQTNDETTLPNGIRIKVLKVEKNRIESVRLILPETQNEKDA